MFQPQDNRVVWDFWITQYENVYHMHYLTDIRRELPHLRHANAKIGYATSTDLVNWQDHGIVFEPSPNKDDWDSRAIWTGSVIVLPEPIDGYKFAFMYTSHTLSVEGFHQKVGLALSNDFKNWHRYEGNPIIEADGQTYTINHPMAPNETAFRDPKVIYDAKNKEFVCFITAERNDVNDWQAGSLALATSKDMKNWTLLPPATAKYPIPQMEVARMIEHKGKYLIVISASEGALGRTEHVGESSVVVFISDDLRGEYKFSQRLYHTKTPKKLHQEPFLYTPEFTTDPDGDLVMIGWHGVDEQNNFLTGVGNPIKMVIDDNYQIQLDQNNEDVKLINKYAV